MKIIHAGDLHLGAVPLGMAQIGRDADRFVAWLAETVRLERPGLLILAGDTFDSPTPLPCDLLPVFRLLKACEEAECRVAIVDGNHDGPSSSKFRRREGRPATGWSSSLQGAFPDTVVPSLRPSPGCPILPHVLPGGLTVLAMDHAPAPVAREFLARIRESGTKCDVLVCHQSAEWAVGGVFEPELSTEDLAGIAGYVAMGDIHRAVRTNLPGRGVAAYCGPSMAIRSPENGHQGAWLIEMSPGGRAPTSMDRLVPDSVRMPLFASISKTGDGLVLELGPQFWKASGGFRGDGSSDVSVQRFLDALRDVLPFSGVARLQEDGEAAEAQDGWDPSDAALVRLSYPSGQGGVCRGDAGLAGNVVRTLLCPPNSVVVVEPRPSEEASEGVDMAAWVRSTSRNVDAVFSDELVDAAIEESARKIVANESLAEEVARLAKEVWRRPDGANEILKK